MKILEIIASHDRNLNENKLETLPGFKLLLKKLGRDALTQSLRAEINALRKAKAFYVRGSSKQAAEGQIKFEAVQKVSDVYAAQLEKELRSGASEIISPQAKTARFVEGLEEYKQYSKDPEFLQFVTELAEAKRDKNILKTASDAEIEAARAAAPEPKPSAEPNTAAEPTDKPEKTKKTAISKIKKKVSRLLRKPTTYLKVAETLLFAGYASKDIHDCWTWASNIEYYYNKKEIPEEDRLSDANPNGYTDLEEWHNAQLNAMHHEFYTKALYDAALLLPVIGSQRIGALVGFGAGAVGAGTAVSGAGGGTLAIAGGGLGAGVIGAAGVYFLTKLIPGLAPMIDAMTAAGGWWFVHNLRKEDSMELIATIWEGKLFEPAAGFLEALNAATGRSINAINEAERLMLTMAKQANQQGNLYAPPEVKQLDNQQQPSNKQSSNNTVPNAPVPAGSAQDKWVQGDDKYWRNPDFPGDVRRFNPNTLD